MPQDSRLLQIRKYSVLTNEEFEEKSESLHSSNNCFTDYELNSQLIGRLESLGYSKPFSIQSATLPHTLKGSDVIGKAVTGSGKSLAFTLPILQKLSENPRDSRGIQKYGAKHPRAIIISPTRELCLQSHKSIRELCPDNVKCVAVYGGSSINNQISEMSRGVDIICATPGRLNDLLKRNAIGLNDVCFICLDEADELLTPNFKDQIEWVLRNSPSDKQMMLFSATMPSDVRRVADQFMSPSTEFVDITKGQKYSMPSSVRHQCMRVYGNHYNPVIEKLLEEHNPDKCIIFCETKRAASKMAETLRCKLRVEALHSDLSQNRRDAIMDKFRKGHATDVAARGLDVPEINLVIQAGTPKNGSDYYVHRSGRTGRAGRDGLAILLHTGDKRDKFIIHEIEKIVKLDHVECSNFAELQQLSIERMCESLQTMRLGNKEIDSLTPILADFDSDTKTRMLMSSLVEKMRQSNSSHTPSSPSNQRNQQSYGRHNHHQHQRRNLYSADDDDEFDSRGRNRHNNYETTRHSRSRYQSNDNSDNLHYTRGRHQIKNNNDEDEDFGDFVSKMQRR